MDLQTALAATDGLVAVVGAGGKKSTLYALADRVERAVVTATVRIPIFDRHVAAVTVTDDPVAAIRAAESWPVGVVPEREREDRYRGYDPATVDDLAAAGVAGTVLVKADGARTREFKAPGEHEPRIPGTADTVLPVASVRAVGEPLSAEHVHRVDRVAALTGLSPGDRIAPADVATVLTHPEGGLKGVPSDATVVPVLNKVDDADREAVAREVAAGVLDRADVARVALTSMTAEEPLVDVVER